MRYQPPIFLATLTIAFLCHGVALASSTHPLFDLGTPSGGPFPSNRFSVPDASQNTGLRVALPKPDCAVRPSDCSDLDLLNELDGFNLSPRLSLPFDGSIDLSTATSANIFVVSLGSTLPGGEPSGHVSGIDQVVWDSAGMTLYVESDELLDQHTRYALVVTKNVLDLGGKAVKAAQEFNTFVDETITISTGDPALDAYRTVLREALAELDASGIVSKGQVVAASVFTTRSASANLEKMRDQIKASTPAPADFQLGPGGVRTVFARSRLDSVVFNRQTNANPAAPLSRMVLAFNAAFNVIPGAVGSIAFGKYTAPDYRVHPGEYIPQVGTRSGIPSVQGTAEVTFLLFLPSSPKPPTGYPVVIYGHGGGLNKSSSAFIVAKMAEHGIATIAIDGPGSGFGPLSTYRLTFTDLPELTFRSGGRGFDQDGDGGITEGEGSGPLAPRKMLFGGLGDFHNQWAADHMQLIRVIEVGVDVDADGLPDLDPSQVYYVGPSGGGRQGAILLAVEPGVRAGVLNVPNGSIVERLSAVRGGLTDGLRDRTPPLINPPGIASIDGVPMFPPIPPYWNENLPLPQGVPYRVILENGTSQVIRSPVVNTVPGALEIQQMLERSEWAFQAANSLVYASCLRRHPLNGVPAKPVIVQFAYGDRLVVNPSTTALLRAGDLADRATFFRSDLAFPSGNPTPFPNNPTLYPHSFLQLFAAPALTARALQAQEQIASFFALDGPSHALDPFDGTQIIDPDSDGPIFEVPIVLPLPIRLNWPGSPALAALSSGAQQLTAGVGEVSEPGRGEVNPVLDLPQPNPLNPSTTLTIHLSASTRVSLAIYDMQGRLVRTLAAGEPMQAGTTRAHWDGRTEGGEPAAPGVYFVRLEAAKFHLARRTVVLK